MPDTVTAGVGLDTTFPSPFSMPSPVTNFRWDRSDGLLKWDKALDTEMSGGYYQIQYSDDSGTTWTDLTQVTQASISTTTATYQDLTGSVNRVYQIKKITSAANGSQSSIYVGFDVEYEATTDRCYVMAYVKDMSLDPFANCQMVISMNVASTIKFVNYKNKTMIPVIDYAVEVETYSGLLIAAVLPSAYITSGTPAVAVKYNIKILGRGSVIQTYSAKTVPTAASAWVRDLS